MGSKTAAREVSEVEEGGINWQAAFAELVAMMLFVITGCGAACGEGALDGETRLLVALAFGMGILSLAYAVGHISGGQINCAVTFSLCLGGQLPWLQGLVNMMAQLVGSVLGALFLAATFPCKYDKTGNLASNVVNPTFGVGRALLGEIFGSFLLCFVVWECAVSVRSGAGINACLTIGFTVLVAHLLLLPFDGCSINPTRSFGPALVSHFHSAGCPNYTPGGMRDLWVMWVGPLIGAALAAMSQSFFEPEFLGRDGRASDDESASLATSMDE